MTDSNILLLPVADPAASSAFYAALLGFAPVEQSATFVLFLLPSGLALGLWRREGMVPAVTASTGSCDLGFRVAPREVDARHAAWKAAGAMILMPPTDLDFGRSFVAADPDGHRLRVYAMAEGAAE